MRCSVPILLPILLGVLMLLSSSCAAENRMISAQVEPDDANRVFALSMFRELNKLRSEPMSFLPDLKERLKCFEGRRLRLGPQLVLVTQEGPKAVEEAMAFLRKAPRLAPLDNKSVLDKAALLHVLDLGPRGGTGHEGSDGSSPGDRMKRFAKLEKASAENLVFGDNDPRGVVLQLLIDDGVPGRGHRHNMFNRKFKVVGVACGPHKVYGRMCVMDFAGGVRSLR